MLQKQANNHLFIQKSAEMYPWEIQSLLYYDRGQCFDRVTLKQLHSFAE